MKNLIQQFIPKLSAILSGIMVLGILLCPSASASPAAAARQLDFANSLYLRNLFDMAATEYAKYVSQFPGNATEEYARFQWGESLYNLQRFEEAEKIYQEQVQKFPQGAQSSTALLRLGEIHFRLENFPEAEKTLSSLLARNPDADITEVARYYLGSTYLALKDYTRARELFQAQLKDAPQGIFSSFAKLNLGMALRNVDDYERAIQLWQEVIAKEKDSTEPRFRNLAIEALYRLGETFENLERFQEAADTYARLAGNYPDSPLLTIALYREAWAHFSAGEHAKAQQKAEALLERPGLPDMDTIRMGLRFLVGLSLFERRNHDEAIIAFEQVLQLPETLPEWAVYAPKARYQMLWCYFLKEDDEKAKAAADRFLEAFPDHSLAGDVLFVKGETLFRMGKFLEARNEYLDLLSNYPDSQYRAESAFKLGQCEYSLKRYQEASRIFGDFTGSYPDHALAPEAALLEGESYFDGGFLKEAAEVYQKFIRAYPERPQVEYALYKLSLCFRQSDDFSKLAEVSQELLKRYPDSRFRPTCLFWIAYEAERKEQNAAAMESYEELIRDYPFSEYANEARLRLAMIYYRQEKIEEAARLFRILIDSDKPPALLGDSIYFWTGSKLVEQGQYENAIAVYQRLVERFPRQDYVEESTYEIANCYYKLRNWSRAAEYYDRVRKEFPKGDFADQAALGRARVYLELNNPTDAITLLEPILNAPDAATAARAGLLLGQAYDRAGQADHAVASFLRVAFLYEHPEIVPEAYYRASEVLLKQGERQKALEHIEEMKKTYPDSSYTTMAKALVAEPAANVESVTVESATP